MTPDQLEARLTRLEKSARRWKIAACTLAFAAFAALAMGQGVVIGGGTGGMSAPVITGDKLIANKSVTLNDSNGNPRIILSADNDLPTIELKDKDTHSLLSLAIDNKNAAHILIQDAQGKKLFAAP